jgi:hypothetical protein
MRGFDKVPTSERPTASVDQVCGTSDFEIGRRYVKRVEIVVMAARVIGSGLGLNEGLLSPEETVMARSRFGRRRNIGVGCPTSTGQSVCGPATPIEARAVTVLTAQRT